MLKKNRRILIASAAVIAVFAATFGIAASLGGITTTSLGADDTVVASCDADGVGASYATIYSAAATAGYRVDSVTVGSVAKPLADTCDGKSIKITLTGAGNASLLEFTGTVPTGVPTVEAFDIANTVLAEDVTGLHIVISG